jgi:integration host factor subunit alpha
MLQDNHYFTLKGAPTMTLKKADLIDSTYNQVGLSRTKSTQAVDSLLEIIKKTLENGEDVLISGFGKFCVKEKRERPGRNPQTGEEFTVKSRRVVTFKCSGMLKGKVNGEG